MALCKCARSGQTKTHGPGGAARTQPLRPFAPDPLRRYVDYTGQTKTQACSAWLATMTIAALRTMWLTTNHLQWTPPAGASDDAMVVELCQTTCDLNGYPCG